MEEKETGGPAFPVPGLHEFDLNGMDLRDYFAAQALAGICAHPNCWGSNSKYDVAHTAYKLADSMLKERSK